MRLLFCMLSIPRNNNTNHMWAYFCLGKHLFLWCLTTRQHMHQHMQLIKQCPSNTVRLRYKNLLSLMKLQTTVDKLTEQWSIDCLVFCCTSTHRANARLNWIDMNLWTAWLVPCNCILHTYFINRKQIIIHNVKLIITFIKRA